jgi:protein Mpv17
VLLETRPIATKSLSAATIALCGDLLCQWSERRSAAAEDGGGWPLAAPPPAAPPRALDLRRTAAMVAWTLLITPGVHHW